MDGEPSPDRILRTGFGFFASKTLLSAVELGVFTELADEPGSLEELEDRLDLHPRGSRDFLDALVALGFLEREAGVYRNTPETAVFLDRTKPSYVGGILEMANDRLYGFWGSLTEALRTGEPQNEMDGEVHQFEAIYADEQRLERFLQAMSGMSLGAATALAEAFPWAEYDAVCDLGTAEGMVPVRLASHHDHLDAIGFDLPKIEPYFESFVADRGLSERVEFRAGDFFEDPLPEADVYVMGHILHDWNLERKKLLVEKAYEALPSGGALVVYGAIIDDERRQNEFGLLMSLNMLVETPGGWDYTRAECAEWLREAGFETVRHEELPGPDSMMVAEKA